MTEQEMGRKAIKFINMWRPEAWCPKGSPGYEAAREIRLEIQRFKKAKRKPIHENGRCMSQKFTKMAQT